jgi:hypothetical protein
VFVSDPICQICGCNEQSELGQNDLVKCPISAEFDAKTFLCSLRNIYSQSPAFAALISSDAASNQRPKRSTAKVKVALMNKLNEKIGSNLIAFEVAKVGFQLENMRTSFFFENGCLKAHLFCIMWSHGVVLNEQNSVSNLDKIICESLLRVDLTKK